MSRYRPGQAESELTQADIVVGLRQPGVKSGDVVLVDSAMRTMGRVHRAPSTVVNALLEVVSDRGTLVVPTFHLPTKPKKPPSLPPTTPLTGWASQPKTWGRHDGNWAKKLPKNVHISW